jgi:hypothetical protein
MAHRFRSTCRGPRDFSTGLKDRSKAAHTKGAAQRSPRQKTRTRTRHSPQEQTTKGHIGIQATPRKGQQASGKDEPQQAKQTEPAKTAGTEQTRQETTRSSINEVKQLATVAKIRYQPCYANLKVPHVHVVQMQMPQLKRRTVRSVHLINRANAQSKRRGTNLLQMPPGRAAHGKSATRPQHAT